MIFYDDFDGEELDRTKWAYDIGTGQNGWGTGQKQYYTNRKDNIFLSNSNLIIRAIKENYMGCNYTSGKLTTKYNMKYGYGNGAGIILVLFILLVIIIGAYI